MPWVTESVINVGPQGCAPRGRETGTKIARPNSQYRALIVMATLRRLTGALRLCWGARLSYAAGAPRVSGARVIPVTRGRLFATSGTRIEGLRGRSLGRGRSELTFLRDRVLEDAPRFRSRVQCAVGIEDQAENRLVPEAGVEGRPRLASIEALEDSVGRSRVERAASRWVWRDRAHLEARQSV